MTIETVNYQNIDDAARIHSVSWQESHRAFCTEKFVRAHTPEQQKEYLLAKMQQGTAVYILWDDAPVAIVSVTGSIIEDLYVLPEYQRRGYGTHLLNWAVNCCTETPTLWVLDNNDRAKRLYEKYGFNKTGNVHQLTEKLSEIEFSLKSGEVINDRNRS